MNEASNLINCAYKEICSGCQYLDLPYTQQKDLKIQRLQTLLHEAALNYLGEIEYVSAGPAYLRDRLDFTLQNGRLGLFNKTSREIVDLDLCAQLSPELQEWLTEFRKFKWPFEKGSFRLRLGPQGQKGLWIDLANIDIKTLLDEGTLLRDIMNTSEVEIGQRRKVPVWNGERFKLEEPIQRPWFQTWMGETAVDLYCQIASFTQPSMKANRKIVDIIEGWIKQNPGLHVIEFGSGIGNLTLPALHYADSLLACEIDALSLEGLEKTLEHLPANLQNQKSKLRILRGDFQRKLREDFSEFDLILCNPPRSGLQKFLDPVGELDKSQRPPYIIYMSCYPESMMVDLAKLKTYGYEIEDFKILDQFPQTEHFEVLGFLKLK
jgi:SAM-dependent methyltransferases related to tRNA (uracil-5-)-methyltransferase